LHNQAENQIPISLCSELSRLQFYLFFFTNEVPSKTFLHLNFERISLESETKALADNFVYNTSKPSLSRILMMLADGFQPTSGNPKARLLEGQTQLLCVRRV